MNLIKMVVERTNQLENSILMEGIKRFVEYTKYLDGVEH